ncbi:TlyA family RNA methyltransferase [Methyloligella sp. 2.7D]|uniref:TlyA family RNA methyltransferase n=1 Tax=unclassified Methyloligella TaxID=2625955 RepID=UPI001FF06A53|nr:TlyA family RNA methyltransferase [Methyloligella sp. GL2]
MSRYKKTRLDQLLVTKGLAETRSRAADAIKRGCVGVDGRQAEKSGQLVSEDADIALSEDAMAFVSRGGLKLAAALDAFGFDPTGRTCLDVGASTGGFTDCLLQRGAASVYAVDIGHGQLHHSLRRNPAVHVMEKTDARSLQKEMFDAPITAITADVSFISLSLVLLRALDIAAPGAFLAALVKPQFELEPEAIGKGGIVRDELDRQIALARVRDFLEYDAGWPVVGEIESPILGGSGNQEFLIGALKPE